MKRDFNRRPKNPETSKKQEQFEATDSFLISQFKYHSIELDKIVFFSFLCYNIFNFSKQKYTRMIKEKE